MYSVLLIPVFLRCKEHSFGEPQAADIVRQAWSKSRACCICISSGRSVSSWARGKLSKSSFGFFTGRQRIALCAQCWHCPSCHWAANSTISSQEPLCLSHLTVKMASRHPWIYQAISCRLQDRRHLRTSNQRTWCLSTRQWSCTWIDNHSCHG